jgi:hypothetical protein
MDLYHNRWLWGGSLCAVGILIARGNPFSSLTPQGAFFIYMGGVFLAILGLIIIASGLDRRTRRMKYCPHCHTLNLYEAEICKSCQELLERDI